MPQPREILHDGHLWGGVFPHIFSPSLLKVPTRETRTSFWSKSTSSWPKAFLEMILTAQSDWSFLHLKI